MRVGVDNLFEKLNEDFLSKSGNNKHAGITIITR
jgi:hypothetical protein